MSMGWGARCPEWTDHRISMRRLTANCASLLTERTLTCGGPVSTRTHCCGAVPGVGGADDAPAALETMRYRPNRPSCGAVQTIGVVCTVDRTARAQVAD